MITLGKPYKEESADTINSRVKEEMLSVVIDVAILKAHSCWQNYKRFEKPKEV